MKENYHTHTWRCNHAVGTEEQYVQHAITRGLSVLGFSDHTPYPFANGYSSRNRMWTDQLPDYTDVLLNLKEQYSNDITLRIGVEAEYYPLFFKDLIALLKDSAVEYMILGQHFIGNEIEQLYSGTETDDIDILKKYCCQAMDAMQTGVFTYFAHPDLINFCGSPAVYRQYIRGLVREAKGCGLPLEINLLGMMEGRHYPSRLFWEIAAEENCQTILGCDAHSPEALSDTAPEEKAIEFANSLGLQIIQSPILRSI